MIVMMFGCLLLAAAIPAFAQTIALSNFVPELSLSYTDPGTGERVECGEDCRRFTVPAGVELEVRVQVHDPVGSSDGNGVTWDLWFNQPNHPCPGFDLAACRDPASGRLNRECWQAMVDRVDRETWDALTADAVCVPDRDEGACRDTVIRVMMDPEFEGARRPGVYHFAVWVNRFSDIPETDEFDDFAGPIRVTVEPEPVDSRGNANAPERSTDGTSDADLSSVLLPSSPRPYGLVIVPEELETVVSLTSTRSQSQVEFTPASAGEVTVEVVQTGGFENMEVQVRKVSSGEVLIEASGKGSLRLEGRIDNFDLKDDRRFEVVVVPGQGSRGIRGSIRISYPARLRYMVDP